jgi:peptidoglycan hydrolase-like protein with peptidoglycan-binding domain
LRPPFSEEANRPIECHLALQRSLQQLGFLPADAKVDGVYGAGTREAISRWQTGHGRSMTGALGDSDAQALEDQASERGASVTAATSSDAKLEAAGANNSKTQAPGTVEPGSLANPSGSPESPHGVSGEVASPPPTRATQSGPSLGATGLEINTDDATRIAATLISDLSAVWIPLGNADVGKLSPLQQAAEKLGFLSTETVNSNWLFKNVLKVSATPLGHKFQIVETASPTLSSWDLNPDKVPYLKVSVGQFRTSLIKNELIEGKLNNYRILMETATLASSTQDYQTLQKVYDGIVGRPNPMILEKFKFQMLVKYDPFTSKWQPLWQSGKANIVMDAGPLEGDFTSHFVPDILARIRMGVEP